jgi:ABC-type bacteriocin/lantibiotic exporter with double-glycine peptidase domain
MSIGAIYPFIQAIISPDKIFKTPYVSNFINYFSITRPAELITLFAVLFGSLALISGISRLILLKGNYWLSATIASELSVSIYTKTLHQPYIVHLRRSSSEIISGTTQKVNITANVLIYCVNLLTSAILLIIITFVLILANPLISAISILFFLVIYFLIAWWNKRELHRSSKIISEYQAGIIRSLQEGLGAIRDVIVDNNQEFYIKTYRNSIFKLLKANGNISYLGQSPRLIIESIGMLAISLAVLKISHTKSDLSDFLPLLAVFAIGAQRVLPIMQQIYLSWSNIMGGMHTISDVVSLLKQRIEINSKSATNLYLNQCIKIDKITYRYNDNGPNILKGVSMVMPLGARVGIVGASGSGKSTLLDIIMGLITPNSGSISIDSLKLSSDNISSWQKLIAHVPQSIFITDNSIAENIAFGIEKSEINYEKLYRAATDAQIADFINTLPNQYSTVVGERGSKLSGGQRQRIGIARALYKNAKILIFDEATSALDNNTEEDVMSAINDLKRDLTIIIVAHRVTTLLNCDVVYELKDGLVEIKHRID